MLQEVMTAEQLARYLQLDEQTIYRKVRSGQIPAIRIGKIVRFKKDLIDGWLRLLSLKWSQEKREGLRTWGKKFARSKNLKEKDIERTIYRRRHLK